MTFRIKDWKKFQHYAKRRPPWIRLYRELLDDVDFDELDADDVRPLIKLWLIASEDETREGILPDVRKVAHRLRLTSSELLNLYGRLAHWVQDDSKMLVECPQDATPDQIRGRSKTEGGAPAHVDTDQKEELEHMTGLMGELARHLLQAFPQYDEYSAMMTAKALRHDAEKIDWRATVDAVAKRWGDAAAIFGGQDKLRSKLVNWFEAEVKGTFKKTDNPPEQPSPNLRPETLVDLDKQVEPDREPPVTREQALEAIKGLTIRMTIPGGEGE